MPEILAAIDIGTNSFHLVIAEMTDKGFKVITKDKEVVRLGSSSKDMKYLSPEAIERGVAALKRFKLICDSFKANIRAVATSATREASNKDEFILRVFTETGIHIEIVSGYEEARLIYLGVLQALDVFDKKIMLVDIGGGSTEFLVGEKGKVEYGVSLKLGAVRLTHKYFGEGKLKGNLINDARAHIRSTVYPVARETKEFKPDIVIGTSGTISTLAMMTYIEGSGDEEYTDFNLNNYTFTAKALSKTVALILKAETTAERSKLSGIDPKRADIIAAGALILEQVFEELKLMKMTVSTYALREGILYDTINKITGTEHIGHLSDVRYASVLKLAETCNYEKEHTNQVWKLADKIFNFIKNDFNLGEQMHEYLEAACILHDTGYHISHSAHHKHSYYLVRNAEMLGFNDTEIEIIANTARYHRKSHPKPKHEWYAKLDSESKRIVRELASILRIADGLDRGHNSSVKDINLSRDKETLIIQIVTGKDVNPELELWGAEGRKELFEETYGLKVNFSVSS